MLCFSCFSGANGVTQFTFVVAILKKITIITMIKNRFVNHNQKGSRNAPDSACGGFSRSLSGVAMDMSEWAWVEYRWSTIGGGIFVLV